MASKKTTRAWDQNKFSGPMRLSNVPDYYDGLNEFLDATHGKGFAEKNPQLLGQLVMAAVIDGVGDRVTDSIKGLRDYLRTDHPLMGERLGGIESALQSIATAIEDSGSVTQDADDD